MYSDAMDALTNVSAALWAFTWPPPEERWPRTWWDLPYIALMGFIMLGSSYIRLRRPNTPSALRLLYLLVTTPVMLHCGLNRYTTSKWRSSDGTTHSAINLDYFVAMGAFAGVLQVIELLFLGEEGDVEIRDADLVLQAEMKKRDGCRNQNGAQSGNGVSDVATEELNGAALTNGQFKDHASQHKALARPRCFPGTYVPLEVDLLSSVRGLGYGRGLPQSTAGHRAVLEAQRLSAQPQNIADKQKWQLLLSVAFNTLKMYTILDICESIIHYPGVYPNSSTHGPPSLYEARNGTLGRAGPFIVSTLTGFMVLSGLQYVHGILYSLTVLLTPARQMPITRSRFEPWLINRPLDSTSVRNLWSEHWHALFRRMLVICAYKPTRAASRSLQLPPAVGRALATTAVFALSGLAHEMIPEAALPHFKIWDARYRIADATGSATYNLPLRSPERGFGAFNYAVTRFFVYQAFAIIFEEVVVTVFEPRVAKRLNCASSRLSRQAKKNGSTDCKCVNELDQRCRLVSNDYHRRIIGRLWTYAFMGVTGMVLVDALALHGLFEAFGTGRLAGRLLLCLRSYIS